jgi:phosphoglycolate phosphatase
VSLPSVVVFDLDGTLVDSLPGIARATQETVEAHLGRPAPTLTHDAVRRMIGEGAVALVQRAFAAEDAVMPAGALGTWRTAYGRHAPTGTEPLPGARALLPALRDAGVGLGLCTNKPHAATLALLADLGWGDTFDAVRGAGSAPGNKPDPRHLLTVLDDLGTTPHAAWFIGDSPTDAATGAAAGVHTVLLRHGYSRQPVDMLPADQHLDDLPALGRSLGIRPR